MNKVALAVRLADAVQLSKKTAEEIIEALEAIITQELVHGEEVTIAGFGTFSARVRRGRMGVNPQNPSEKMQIPSVTVPKFKAGKSLKDALKAKEKVATPTV